jgi:DNA invertase Pin-like site-specific DNA recombinase
MFELVANCPEAEPIFTVAAGNLGQDQKQADQIRAMIATGKKPAHVAKRLGVARSSVYRMLDTSVP